MLVAGGMDGLAKLEKVVGDGGWTLRGGLVICAKEDWGRIHEKKRRVDEATPGCFIMSIGTVRIGSRKS
jgi:hypothetical protein